MSIFMKVKCRIVNPDATAFKKMHSNYLRTFPFTPQPVNIHFLITTIDSTNVILVFNISKNI